MIAWMNRVADWLDQRAAVIRAHGKIKAEIRAIELEEKLARVNLAVERLKSRGEFPSSTPGRARAVCRAGEVGGE